MLWHTLEKVAAMKQWIPFITTIVAIVVPIIALWWNISTNMATLATNMATKEDIRTFRSEVNSRLDRIEQNHLEHITQLNVQTKQSNP